MKVRELFNKLRMDKDIADTQKTRFSDYQIANAVNSVLNIVYNALVNISSDLIIEETAIPMIDGCGQLPADFVSVVNVSGFGGVLTLQSKSSNVDARSYRIRKDKIYSANDTIVLQYRQYYIPIDPMNLDAAVPVPDYFAELVKKYAVAILQGANSADVSITQAIMDTVYKAVAGRSANFFEFTPAFKV